MTALRPLVKVLVAPELAQRGIGRLHFSHTRPATHKAPAEILYSGATKCATGFPDDVCGCRRAFIGTETAAATTVGVVAERAVDYRGEVTRAARRAFPRNAEILAKARAEAEGLTAAIEAFPIGARVAVRFDGPEARMTVRALVTGE